MEARQAVRRELFGCARFPLTELQLNILKCLMQGQSDDIIARHVRKGERTVQRIIHDMSEQLGVTVRFALGVAAERNGWMPLEED